MQTRLTLRSGHRGTKRLTRRVGDGLVAVHYRNDATRRRLEVAVRVQFDEPVRRGWVRATGGRWDPRRKVWPLAFGVVRALDPEDRIVPDHAR